jgi:hypothetical protein
MLISSKVLQVSDIKVKTFLEALKLVHVDGKKAKKYLADKRLTYAEKKILQCWFDLKNCEHQKILDDLQSVKTEGDLVESQKNLILGLNFNNMGNPASAKKYLEDAMGMLGKYPLTEHKFICAYNYFIISYNLNHDQDMAKSLRLMETLSDIGINERQELCFEQCKFNYFTFHQSYYEAQKILIILEDKKEEMSEAVVMAHQISKFIFYLKQGLYDDCEMTLEEMKQYRLFRDTPNFLYMRLMLSHLKNDTPLYFYEKDFKQSYVLFIQLMVIKCLEESKPVEANIHWNELKKIDPTNYGDHFKYLGQTNLMSLCLKKHEKKIQVQQIKLPFFKNKVEALWELLSAATGPIPREILFKSLWGRDMLDPSDDEKLKNLIYYTRKSKDLEIVFRKGCYSLAPKKIASSVG